MTSRALLLAAPTSGAGKTTLTLGLLRAFKHAGLTVRGAKSGPDYIDPQFHQAASGHTCFNLDAWAMPPNRIRHLARDSSPLLIEGAMGLFDGAPPDGKGASADLARILGIPVVLIVDAAKTAQSIAPLVAGFAGFSSDVEIAGILLNRVGSDRHENILRAALAPTGIPVLGAIHRSKLLERPSRHLGLVQASEHSDLERFLDAAAQKVATRVDLDTLLDLARPMATTSATPKLAPPAQQIAVARDDAFAFSYPHILKDWRDLGAEIQFFSPLNDDPVPKTDFIFLPGGYPELHAQTLANAEVFSNSMQKSARAGTQIYGECGGYMTLGDGFIDASGQRHKMLGLLPLETSFEKRKLHLGYRNLVASSGPFKGAFKGHEFHYATTLSAKAPPLFEVTDAEGTILEPAGQFLENIAGSFAHIIDCV